MKDRTQPDFILNTQFTNIDRTLGEEFGETYRAYRERYYNTLNYDSTGFVPEFPLTIGIELVNRCNLSCVMCFTDHHKTAKATLDIATIKTILTECQANDVPCVQIGMGSEALLYKQIKEVLVATREADVADVWLSTNGVLLDRSLAQSLIEHRVARVVISLDAATPETYQKIRGKDELGRIEHNIYALLHERRRKNSRIPLVRVSFCVQEENLHECEAFLGKWEGVVDYVDFQKVITYEPLREMLRHQSQPAQENVTPTLVIPAPAAESKASAPAPGLLCDYPFNSLHIWSTGDVAPCCDYYGKRLILGNLAHSSLENLWNGDKIKRLRHELSSGRPNPVCAACLGRRKEGTFSAARKIVEGHRIKTSA